MSRFRIQSTLENGDRSRLDKYWNDRGFRGFYKKFRKGLDLPKSLQSLPNSTEVIEKKFHLRGFQFGNWLTIEDRFNYLAALYVCLYDLNKVLKFKNNNLGLDESLGISFGARGSSAALAHYEPNKKIINITRYKNISGISKLIRFINTGGVGALAHEYGHFLDYYFGANYEVTNNYFALSNGRSVSFKRIPYAKNLKMRNLMEDILEKAYWRKANVPSAYIKRIQNFSKREYFVRRNEIFARLFEQYIAYKLKQRGINNRFLTETKYSEKIYMKPSELKRVIPLFDKLIVEMRKYF